MMNFGDVKTLLGKLKLMLPWKRQNKSEKQPLKDCKSIDPIEQAYVLVGLKNLHDMRYNSDENYRIEYHSQLEEVGLSMAILKERDLLYIPANKEDMDVIIKDKESSERSEKAST